MVINQLETNLQAITTTIAYLEKNGCDDEVFLGDLRKERDRILKDLNVMK
ncbi:hypothetical protein [Methanobrevibacter filiformis]|uniref:Uncharacterized protein n=1 Tax=Methanobrevibacter filiformis TaxID=55758 RepID=A0A166CV93_9EURY|nr:hypothetical protein [Methanobrevibacter filiformis]KZX17057.1 hypothetical protein MBFIL_03740 [Methanobrevibacter filiformis]